MARKARDFVDVGGRHIKQAPCDCGGIGRSVCAATVRCAGEPARTVPKQARTDGLDSLLEPLWPDLPGRAQRRLRLRAGA